MMSPHPLTALAESIVGHVPATQEFYRAELAKRDNTSAAGIFIMDLSSWFDDFCHASAYGRPVAEVVSSEIPWHLVIQAIEEMWPKMSQRQREEFETHFIESLSLGDSLTRTEILSRSGRHLREFIIGFLKQRGVLQ
jgi:hypothetical protein